MKLGTKNDRRVWWLGMLCVAGVLAGYCIIVGFCGMPPTEGWYTWYAELINNGEVVYRDFSYLFYPFYIQFIALFCKVFGYNILALRILGLFVFTGIGVAAYLLFSRLTNVPGAAVGAVATTMFLQSEVVQIFYDYIRFMDIFAYLSVYFLVCYMQRIKELKDTKKLSASAIFCALFGTLACMVKQSTGTLLIVYTVVLFAFAALVLYKTYAKRILQDLLTYLAVVAVLFAVMFVGLLASGALEAFFVNATGSALDAKGGLANVLFRWIQQNLLAMRNQLVPGAGILSFAVLLRIVSHIHVKETGSGTEIVLSAQGVGKWGKAKASAKENMILLLAGTLMVGGLLLLTRKFESFREWYRGNFDYTMPVFGFVLCTMAFAAIGFWLLFRVLKKRKAQEKQALDDCILPVFPWFALLGAIFAIGYGSGISGGLCESQTALSVGFLIVLLSKALENSKFRILGMVLLILYGTTFSVACASRKYVEMYSWWGLSEGPVWEADYTAKSPMLAGIKMTKNEQLMYDGVLEIVEENTDEDDTIFCFPHIPIFYSLTGRTSSTYTQVQWFDVSNVRDINRDIQTLKDNPP